LVLLALSSDSDSRAVQARREAMPGLVCAGPVRIGAGAIGDRLQALNDGGSRRDGSP
jgi:hypothetical protein